MITTKAFSDAVTTFHNLLISIEPHVTFTIEQEYEGRLAFLDTLTTRNNGTITSDVHRKPTHTDRYLDYHSHQDKNHKISTAVTLLHRATTLPNTEEGKIRETKHVTDALISNSYPMKFISEIKKKQAFKEKSTPTPEELVGVFFALTDPDVDVTNKLRYFAIYKRFN